MSFLQRDHVSLNCFGYTINLGNLAALPLVVGYALCSSLLAIINKYALVQFPYPALLTALQYVTCVVAVLALGRMKVLEHDPLTLDMMWRFLPPASVFYFAIYTNTQLLKYANVDTFIVFRSCTPILVAIADPIFRKTPWPSAATFGSLFFILAGAVGYVVVDKEFTVTAYTWAGLYLVTITLEMVYIKHVVSSFGMNTWGFVLYNNFLSLLIFPIFFYIFGEFKETMLIAVAMSEWKMSVVWPVALSCIFGLAISFFGFACRKAISATAFTVVGVTNKFLTVIVNVLVWDRHASNTGILCLLVTIVGGVLYQQSTVKPKPSAPLPAPDEEAAKPLKGSDTEMETKGTVVSDKEV